MNKTSKVTIKKNNNMIINKNVNKNRPYSQNLNKENTKIIKKNKEKMEDKLIELSIKKIQNEKSYEILIKMREANKICEELWLNKSYRVFNSASEVIKCHIYENGEFKEEITLEVFEREYKYLIKQFYKNRNLKIWQMKNEKNNNKRNLLNLLNQNDDKKIFKEKQIFNKKERQNDLKLCLSETMKLTKTLKNQLNILKKKGINNIIIPQE